MSEFVARKLIEWRVVCAVCQQVRFLTHGQTVCATCSGLPRSQ